MKKIETIKVEVCRTELVQVKQRRRVSINAQVVAQIHNPRIIVSGWERGYSNIVDALLVCDKEFMTYHIFTRRYKGSTSHWGSQLPPATFTGPKKLTHWKLAEGGLCVFYKKYYKRTKNTQSPWKVVTDIPEDILHSIQFGIIDKELAKGD